MLLASSYERATSVLLCDVPLSESADGVVDDVAHILAECGEHWVQVERVERVIDH